MRLVLLVVAVAVAVLVVRSRRGVEVWHAAADQPFLKRGLSSVGRALPLQGRSQGFESPRLHSLLFRLHFALDDVTKYSCHTGLCSLPLDA